ESRALDSDPVGLHDLLRRPLDAQQRARHEVEAVGEEVQGLARTRILFLRDQRAVRDTVHAACELALEREVPGKELARATIADGDAESIAKVVLGVPRDEDLVTTALGEVLR